MMMEGRAVLALLLLLACGLNATLVNEDVDRTIDLTNHLATITTKVKVANKGSAAATSYKLSHDAGLEQHLAYVSVSVKGKAVPTTAVSASINLAAGETADLVILSVYTHVQTPYPAKITQEEQQLVIFTANTFFSSQYDTVAQKTTVKVAGKLEAVSKGEKISQNDKTVTLGPYQNKPAGSSADFSVHFENNTPFLTVTSLDRDIQVSHWGTVTITEDVSLAHSGAVLKGPFSRLDLQRNPRSAPNIIKSFKAKLPAAAEEVYYRDVIGNISTSNVLGSDEAVTAELRPRFPLMGGWKTRHTLGYTLPTYEVLSTENGAYALRVRIVDHLYDNMVIDEATVRVALPEGATDITVDLPFAVDSNTRETRVATLDFNARPVVVLRARNLVEEHMQEIVVRYQYSQILLLQKPVLVALVIFAALAAIIAVNRLDLAIDGGAKRK